MEGERVKVEGGKYFRTSWRWRLLGLFENPGYGSISILSRNTTMV